VKPPAPKPAIALHLLLPNCKQQVARIAARVSVEPCFFGFLQHGRRILLLAKQFQTLRHAICVTVNLKQSSFRLPKGSGRWAVGRHQAEVAMGAMHEGEVFMQTPGKPALQVNRTESLLPVAVFKTSLREWRAAYQAKRGDQIQTMKQKESRNEPA
jgi:hypothetical protein